MKLWLTMLGSPKEWRRHLDGCANLIEAVRIHGFMGGIEQALFWCFARMGKYPMTPMHSDESLISTYRCLRRTHLTGRNSNPHKSLDFW